MRKQETISKIFYEILSSLHLINFKIFKYVELKNNNINENIFINANVMCHNINFSIRKFKNNVSELLVESFF